MLLASFTSRPKPKGSETAVLKTMILRAIEHAEAEGDEQTALELTDILKNLAPVLS